MQVRRGSLFDIISFPAKTALTSIMYASYAALIYLVSELLYSRNKCISFIVENGTMYSISFNVTSEGTLLTLQNDFRFVV